MEKLFGISYNDLPFAGQKVFQAGRLCISKTLGPEGSFMPAVLHVCQGSGGTLIAECDKKLLRVLNLLGIKTKVLGDGVLYRRAVTVPTYFREEWLKTFLRGDPYVYRFNDVQGCNTAN